MPNSINVCIIPARGGSKRIPRKNIRTFSGKPMIAWSIEAALTSLVFDRVIVSTDDAEISDIAKQYGAEVPFTRPKDLSDDLTGTTPVVNHALNWIKSQDIGVKAACCLYATAPFVDPRDIRRGQELLSNIGPDRFVLSASEYPSPIQRAFTIDSKTGYAKMCRPEEFPKRSQDLAVAYHDAGQFYWATEKTWRTTVNIFDGAGIVVLPSWRVQDIDNENDWKRAEIMKKVIDIQTSSQ